MTSEVLAEWLRRQGCRIVTGAESQWYFAGFRVLQSFPYGRLVEPRDGEIEELLRQHRAVAARYWSPVSSRRGVFSYHVIYDEPGYSISTLSSAVRRDIRRGERGCTIEILPWERMARDGAALAIQTAVRQRRSPEEGARWVERCRAGEGLDGVEGWGALVGAELAACAITVRCDDTVYIVYQHSGDAYLSMNVNSALVSKITAVSLGRQGVKRVHYGVESLDAPTSVDAFKVRLGYSKVPVKHCVVTHDVLGRLARPLRAVVALSARVRGGQGALTKADGLLKVYLSGR